MNNEINKHHSTTTTTTTTTNYYYYYPYPYLLSVHMPMTRSVAEPQACRARPTSKGGAGGVVVVVVVVVGVVEVVVGVVGVVVVVGVVGVVGAGVVVLVLISLSCPVLNVTLPRRMASTRCRAKARDTAFMSVSITLASGLAAAKAMPTNPPPLQNSTAVPLYGSIASIAAWRSIDRICWRLRTCRPSGSKRAAQKASSNASSNTSSIGLPTTLSIALSEALPTGVVGVVVVVGIVVGVVVVGIVVGVVVVGIVVGVVVGTGRAGGVEVVVLAVVLSVPVVVAVVLSVPVVVAVVLVVAVPLLLLLVGGPVCSCPDQSTREISVAMRASSMGGCGPHILGAEARS
jgi:hypothetical protein